MHSPKGKTSSWQCRLKLGSLILISLLFIAAGINHFVRPAFYLQIMPGYLPWPLGLVYVSGFFEVLGGVCVAVPWLRRAAGWGLIALLVAVLPANVQMLTHADDFRNIPFWALLARVPLQGLLILWVWWAVVNADETLHESSRDAHQAA